MKVLLIDDHPLILSALQSVIQGLGDNIAVSTSNSGHAARMALGSDIQPYDLVLLDLQLGDADGFDLLAELRSLYPALPVVVISATDRSSDVIRAIDMGALGFVPKRATNEVLIEALQQVLSGGVYVPPMTMGPDLHKQFNCQPQARQLRAEASQAGYQGAHPLTQLGITPRQADVLHLLLKGLPNKLIARELNLSVDTVKDHVASVLRVLGVSSRTQAVIAVSQSLQTYSSALSRWQPAA